MKSYKKEKRKCITLLITILLAFSIVGCSGSNSTQTPESTQQADDNTAKDSRETAEIGTSQQEVYGSEATLPEIPTESVTSSDDKGTLVEETVPEVAVSENSSADIGQTTLEVEESVDTSQSYVKEKDDGLTPTMRNSINMLNYMTSLTQRINEEKGNQLFLESAYYSFDNLFPNSVDNKTQVQITSLMDTIQGYRMISVKRARLEYIYEQNRAQALRQAIPNPIGLLSAVQSGSMLRVAASVLYMAVDSATSYQAATSQADLQFIKDGWELDDAESKELHESNKNALNYMYDMVQDYDIPGDYALNKGAVDNFVSWSRKPDSQLERKISWFETNQGTYAQFGPYWLELAKDYYNYEDYSKCLDAVKQYESISTRIFRKDIDYAAAIPMAILSAKETKGEDEYIKSATEYCALIRKNTEDKDWALRYFAAQVYMDLYALTKNESYLNEAYKIARENVVVLVDEQKELNTTYLADIKEIKADKDATKRQKEEIKQYNKMIKNERKIAVPPVSEALYLNSDLLFALARERGVDITEQRKIEAILHGKGENIFLTKILDDRFWFENKEEDLNADTINASYNRDSFTIPASCVTDRSTVVATITGSSGTTILDDWTVTDVKRPKGSNDCSEFIVTFKSKAGEQYKYKGGETVTIVITPVEETPEEHLDFTYNVVASKIAFIIDDVKFERATK